MNAVAPDRDPVRIEDLSLAEMDLETVAILIRDRYGEYGTLSRRALSLAWDVGRLLSEAKRRVGHGNWLDWLAGNVSMGAHTAQRFIALFLAYPRRADLPADRPISQILRLLRSETEPPDLAESRFQAAVIQRAGELGWRCHASRAPLGDPGFPDLILVRPPRLIFAELKVGGPVRAEQSVWLAVLALCPSAVSVVWRPADWPQIESTLAGGA